MKWNGQARMDVQELATRKPTAWKRARTFVHAIVLVLTALVFSSCTLTGPDIEDAGYLNERSPKIANFPNPEETVRGKDDPASVTLQLGKGFRQNNLKPSEELPLNIKIGTTNLNNVPLSAALQAVLADTDISVIWENPQLQDSPVTLMNLKGALSVVVERVCRAAKTICAYRNGSLEILSQDTFVVELPASVGKTDAASNTITSAIESLIEGKVKADSNGGNLIYTTNAEGHERVQSYLEQLRNGRPLVVLQLYIWEVQLEDSKSLGVNWTGLAAKVGGLSSDVALSSTSAVGSVASGQGVSLGAVFSGIIDANTLAGFLSKQGKVQNISSPQLTFVSGTGAKFEIGGNQRYISQIGTQNTVGGTSNTSNSVVSTEELKTGLAIDVTGSYEGGVVFANLSLETADLVQFQEFPAGGTNLKLPQTSDRKVETVLRVRPGDNLVLAGLQTSRDTRAREGFPTFLAGDIPMSGSNTRVNSELVILVKPSVVFFSDREAIDLRSVEKKTPAPTQMAQPALPVANKENIQSPLQDEFGTVVKLYEDVHRPVAKPVREDVVYQSGEVP